MICCIAMSDYLVTIIIPTLNEEKFISRCLDSVISQTYPFSDMNVLVIDGGSIDKTYEIVSSYREKYNNIRLINNPGRIQSIAFNIGVNNSDTPYIVRLDAHAVYNERYVELCVKHLQANADYGNGGGICIIKAKKNTLMANTNMILNQSLFGIGGSKFRIGCEAACVDTVPFGAFRREVIEKVGGMREDMPRAEDNEINSRIHKYGYKVYLDPQIISSYYARDTFWGSVKQMFNNGVSIGHLFYVDKSAIGLRHFIPFLFVVGVICGLFFSLFSKCILYLYLSILSLYLILNLAASAYECKAFGWKYMLSLPLLFVSVHIAYGVGTIVGLFKYNKVLVSVFTKQKIIV